MTVAILAPHDVQTTLHYYKAANDEPPYNYVEEPPAGVPRSNVGEDTHPAVIHDIRGKEDTVGLDKTGFQFIKHVSEEKEFVDEKAIETRYYKEVEDILKTHAGAKKVVIFDHTIRRNAAGAAGVKGSRGPVQRVHVDQTFEAGVNRVYRHLGDDVERFLKGRVRIINVWRPIGNPVAHHPLAVVDYRSIDPARDLVSTRLIYPDREGSTFSVRYNPQHKWYFLADQTPEEVTLIKCFDSDVDKARLTPHSAFKDSTSPPDAPNRQSIEVRALVFDTE
ncbi:hypothetical protein BV22DRAFT_1038333 [Leucogyrophana mollusca]|uniref:Uncharacterized protein n=1 Tax=Leucogyrophana mollusca TaxID=85980 RepID=A0ACB8B7Q5_9AGAM|nr:hypothetical protein BV22DRAFT_1038333 [Leucogyrophana mollusca]